LTEHKETAADERAISVAPAGRKEGLMRPCAGCSAQEVISLIILRPRQDQLAAIIIIAANVPDLLQEAGINFHPRLELKVAEPDGIPDGEGAVAFELQRQINEFIFFIPRRAAPHFVSLRAHNYHNKSAFKSGREIVRLLGMEVTSGAFTYSCELGDIPISTKFLAPEKLKLSSFNHRV
jgi:hypothetical protein